MINMYNLPRQVLFFINKAYIICIHPDNYANLSLNNCNADYIHVQSLTITFLCLLKQIHSLQLT